MKNKDLWKRIGSVIIGMFIGIGLSMASKHIGFG